MASRSGKHKRPRLHIALPASPEEEELFRAAAAATGKALAHWLMLAALKLAKGATERPADSLPSPR